jgi:hypothetical protein
MSLALEILNELQQRGVSVAADGDTLCLKPRSALDDALLTRVRNAKPAILEALRNGNRGNIIQIAACGSPGCAGCYDVIDGRQIHPPKCGKEYLKGFEKWLPTGRPQ